ncbi:hypothetical protein [Nocardia sp. NPDC006630]|uniref:hypothetical protein n=1 Tax=Nocardia sp. NPDC006630 TaxID=3157181 RepID=UPI0033B8C8BC
MTWRTRLVQFPGGLLEVLAYEGESANEPGVYMEHFLPVGQNGDRPQGEAMLYKPTALGYLRTDVSGASRFWDESQIRDLAARLGYDFSGMVRYDPLSGRRPLARLKAQATRLDAQAVIVPGSDHFEGGQVPQSLLRQLDLIIVSPEETHTRRPTSPRGPDADVVNRRPWPR